MRNKVLALWDRLYLTVPMEIGDGSVEPGIEGTPGGKLTVEGGIDFSSAAILKIEIGNGEADELEVPTGTASLGGSVVPILTDNTIPPPGSSFTILYGPTVTGVFDFIDHSRLPAGASFAATYAPTTAILVSQAPPATTTLAEWEGRNFSIDDLLDDLISGPDADPDKDGLKNQQEYLHGLPPKAPGLSPVELSGSGPGYIEITFPWLKAAQDGEFSPQLSGNLTGFQDTAYTVVAETDEGAITRYTLRVPFSTAPAFVRLRTQIVSE